jgi:hypothetical protein
MLGFFKHVVFDFNIYLHTFTSRSFPPETNLLGSTFSFASKIDFTRFAGAQLTELHPYK